MATRDTTRYSKLFSITESTEVCSLHFKEEHLKKSQGIERLTYVDGAVPSVFAWKRSSPRKRPPPRPRAHREDVKARASLDMSAVFISNPEAQASMDHGDSNIDLCLETDSASTTSENASCVSENRPSYEDLRKQLIIVKWSVHSKTVNRKTRNWKLR